MEDIQSFQFTHPCSEQRETVSRKRERMIFVKDTIPTPRFLRRFSVRNSPSCAEGLNPRNSLVDRQTIQISDLHFVHISYLFHVFVLEGKIQDRSMCLLLISLGGGVVGQRSGNG